MQVLAILWGLLEFFEQFCQMYVVSNYNFWTLKWHIKNGGIKCKQTWDAVDEMATKSPTNLPTLRLNFWQFLRVGRVTRNEDFLITAIQKIDKRKPNEIKRNETFNLSTLEMNQRDN